MTAAPAPRSDLRLLCLLAAVAVAARAITFGNPIVHVDEEFYFTAARAWIDGAIPYTGVWDRKPIGLFALYLPAAALGYPAGIWAYQAMAFASVVATAWIIARIARTVGWSAGAPYTAVAYILWLNLAEGQGGQSPVFYNLLIAAAAWLIVGERAARKRRAVAAMMLTGVALQIKYSVLFEGLFFGLWIVAQHWRALRRAGALLAFSALLVAIALVPTGLAVLGYAVTGHFPDFGFANFHSILIRRADPMREQLGNLAILSLILSPLIAMAIVAWRDARVRGMSADLGFVFGWLAASCFGLLVFGSWFDHYALPVMVPASLCAAGTVTWRAEVRRWAIPILAFVALGGQVLLVSKRLGRGSPAQFAALTQAVGRGPGCLYVYSGETMLYPATGRCHLSRHIFPSHLSRTREEGAIGVDQASEVRRILLLNPAVIVMRPPYRGERPEIRAIVERAVASGYRLRATLPMGRERVRVFSATKPS